MERLNGRYGIVVLVTLVLLLLSIVAGVAAASVMSPPPGGSDMQSVTLSRPFALSSTATEIGFHSSRI